MMRTVLLCAASSLALAGCGGVKTPEPAASATEADAANAVDSSMSADLNDAAATDMAANDMMMATEPDGKINTNNL